MSDDLIKIIYFDQHLTLKKSEYERRSDNEVGVSFTNKDGVILRPLIFFRPINMTEIYGEYQFSELIFECYEGHADLVSQSVEENDSEYHVVTRYFMSHQDELGSLMENKFVYKQEYYTFEYQIENSLVPADTASTPLNPLGLSGEGTLKCWEEEVPLDKYLALLNGSFFAD